MWVTVALRLLNAFDVLALVPALVLGGALLVAFPYDLVVLVEALVGVRHFLRPRARQLRYFLVLVGATLHRLHAAAGPVDNTARSDSQVRSS